MAVKSFNSLSGIINYVEIACNVAVKNVSDVMVSKLKDFIQDDFYDLYYPRIYRRTYSLLRSPTANLIGNAEAEIFINTDAMEYFDITGEEVAKLAMQGFHGSEDIFRPGYYWEDFASWCKQNVIILLKQELIRQGLNIR